MLEPRSTRPRWTIGRLMLAVALAALLIGLPATLGRPGTLVLGFILGISGAAVIPAMLACAIESRMLGSRDRGIPLTMTLSGAILGSAAWWIVWKEPMTGFAGLPLAQLGAFTMGYGAFLLAASAGLIEAPSTSRRKAATIASLIVVLATLPFAIGAGMVFAGMIASIGGRV